MNNEGQGTSSLLLTLISLATLEETEWFCLTTPCGTCMDGCC
jgi:hypothetical protein